jgi:hypothetical protein
MTEELITCSNCKKKHFKEGFKVSRLNVRHKGKEKECADRRKQRRQQMIKKCQEAYKASLCPHEKNPDMCRQCDGCNAPIMTWWEQEYIESRVSLNENI